MAGGFVSGVGNAWNGGASFGQGLAAGGIGAGFGAVTGGAIGGVSGGINATKEDLGFFFKSWKKFDLSKGAGFHPPGPGFDGYDRSLDVGDSRTFLGTYKGKFEDALVFEAKNLGTGKNSGGVTFPGFGKGSGTIVVGDKVYSDHSNFLSSSVPGHSNPLKYSQDLLRHEYGHILQAKDIGVLQFYHKVGSLSLGSATINAAGHSNFWTEKWANYLSNNYFKPVTTGTAFYNTKRYPIKNISTWLHIWLRL